MTRQRLVSPWSLPSSLPLLVELLVVLTPRLTLAPGPSPSPSLSALMEPLFTADFFLKSRSNLVNVTREITTDTRTIVTPATSGVVKKEFKLTRASEGRKEHQSDEKDEDNCSTVCCALSGLTTFEKRHLEKMRQLSASSFMSLIFFSCLAGQKGGMKIKWSQVHWKAGHKAQVTGN